MRCEACGADGAADQAEVQRLKAEIRDTCVTDRDEQENLNLKAEIERLRRDLNEASDWNLSYRKLLTECVVALEKSDPFDRELDILIERIRAVSYTHLTLPTKA